MKIGMKYIFHYQAKFEANLSGRCWKYKLYLKNHMISALTPNLQSLSMIIR
jgi:hypothetical protein